VRISVALPVDLRSRGFTPKGTIFTCLNRPSMSPAVQATLTPIWGPSLQNIGDYVYYGYYGPTGGRDGPISLPFPMDYDSSCPPLASNLEEPLLAMPDTIGPSDELSAMVSNTLIFAMLE
jgi:hypothetical protein